MATRAIFRAEDVEGIQSLTGRRYELVRGELYEVVTTMRHGAVMGRVFHLIDAWNQNARAGYLSADAGYILERAPDTVRGPDVSFIRKERMVGISSRKGFPELAPDLAVEVRSVNDTWAELVRKAGDFLDRGTRMVVLIEADKFVEVHRPDHKPVRLGLDGIFDGEDVLPGFSCPVSELFPEEYA